MNRVGLGLAIGAGYLLGRTKKAKMALAVGSVVAGKKLNLTPKALAELVTTQLAGNPQFKEIGDQLRQDLRGVGKAASGALVERQIEAIADRLHGRTAEVREQLAGGGSSSRDEDGHDDEDEEPEGDEPRADEDADDAEDSEHAEDSEDFDDEDSDAEDSGDEERERRGPAKKAAKKAPAKKAPAKKAPAKKTAAKKTAPAKKAAAKKTGSARSASRRTTGGSRRSQGGDGA
ncbi:DNA primase [Streptomyces sp. NPDC088763]|uniref:DNA primase n=1 Tax=Streptomyces sp. NPDC088763 TaxID=3365892 RepID=UPI0038120578